MRKSKRNLWLSAFLCVVLLLSACGNSSGNTPADSKKEASESKAAMDGSDAPDKVSEGAAGVSASVIDFDEQPYEVTIEILVGRTGELQDEEKVEAALNEITLPQANLTVDIKAILLAEHATKMSLWATTGEKVDLVMAGMSTPFNGLVANESLQPFTEELKTRAPRLMEMLGVLVDSVTVNGEIYAVPAILYPAENYVFYYNQELANQYGIEVPETCSSYEDIDKVFKQVADSGMPAKATSIGVGVPSSAELFDSMGDALTMAYGVLMLDDSGTEIVNYYESEAYKKLCEKRREWYLNGYGVEDALTSGMNSSQMMKAGTIFGYFAREGSANTLAFAEANTGVKLGRGLTGPVWFANKHVLDYTWGISINSERPDKCVDLLNLIYTNKDVMNLLANGIEGVNYVRSGGNIIDYPQGMTAATSGYAQLISKIGDSRYVYQFSPLTEDYYKDIDKYDAKNADIVSPALGFTADVSDLQADVAAITNVVNEYKDSLAYGIVDVEQTLPAFNKALEDAGIHKVVEEVNRQFQEWISREK